MKFRMHEGGLLSSPSHGGRGAEPMIRPKAKVRDACERTPGCEPEGYQPYVDFPYDNSWYPEGKYQGTTYREAWGGSARVPAVGRSGVPSLRVAPPRRAASAPAPRFWQDMFAPSEAASRSELRLVAAPGALSASPCGPRPRLLRAPRAKHRCGREARRSGGGCTSGLGRPPRPGCAPVAVAGPGPGAGRPDARCSRLAARLPSRALHPAKGEGSSGDVVGGRCPESEGGRVQLIRSHSARILDCVCPGR